MAGESMPHVLQTYRRARVAPVRGEGVWLYTEDGRRYLDFTSGIGVTVLGHAHPAVTRAIAEQAGRLLHCSNLYEIPQQEELAAWLCEHTGFAGVFFCNSGTEAVEALLKLARRWGDAGGRHEVLSLAGSFHGRTLGSLSATGQDHHRKGFGPLLPGVRQVPAGDLAALADAIGPQTCAVLLEPVLGEGGVLPFSREYLSGVRELCDRHDLLLLFDEVQTGCGRTGAFLAAQRVGVMPDACALAKGLANGVPIGAMLVRKELCSVLAPGSHASTFGGNPLAMAAGLATVRTLAADGLIEGARRKGEQLAARLREAATGYAWIQEVRGLGLMLGLVLNRPAASLSEACLEHGLLTSVAGGRTLRLLPPLIIGDAEIEEAVQRLERALADEDRLARGRQGG